jgi:hypothetical protein
MARRIHATGRPVLILDRENPKVVVDDRFHRLEMSDDETFRVWGGWVGQEAPQPASAIVLDWVTACDPRPVVIVDSMIAFHGGDENSASDMRTFLNQLRRLADLGATPVLLHHDGKAETSRDYRGSSDFKAGVDFAFHISNYSADGRLGKLTARCYKSRLDFFGQVVYDYAGGKLIRAEDEDDANENITDQLTSLLRMNPGITARKFDKLAADRGLGRAKARTWLEDGVLSGAIRRELGKCNVHRHFLKAQNYDVQ